MAVIHLSYTSCLKGTRREFDFNTDTGAITAPIQDAVRNPDAPGCLDDLDLIYQDADWQVLAMTPYPYAQVVTKVVTCDLAINDVEVVYDRFSGTARATMDVDNGAGVTLEYQMFAVGLRRPWQASNVFETVPPGEYYFQVRQVASPDCVKSMVKSVAQSVFDADVKAVNETAPNLDDGKVIATILGGSGNYRVDWLWDATFTNVSGSGSVSAQRTGLPAGTYMVQIFDLTTNANDTFTVTVTEPTVAVPSSSHFYVPKAQSLTFVEEEVVDDINTFETPDNTLYCKSVMPHMVGVPYYQKVAMADRHRVQFQSNYEDAEIIVKVFGTDEVVDTFPAARTVQNIGQESLYPVILRNHGNGQTRVYFNTPAIPLPLTIGEGFALVNNLDGLTGNFTIVDIADDPLMEAQYLVINLNYGIAAPTSAATGKFYTNIVHFDIWEGTVLYGNLDEGVYQVVIKAFTGAAIQRVASSEPIEVKAKHPGTLCIEYYHRHNKFDLNYQTAMVNRIRVEGRMHNFIPAGDDHMIRNTDGTIRRTEGTPYERYQVDFFMIPAYLHRKLNTVFRHSYVSIGKIEVQAPEGYAEPRWLTRYRLASATVMAEIVNVFNEYNSSAVGIDGESGFLKVSETGLLKVS